MGTGRTSDQSTASGLADESSPYWWSDQRERLPPEAFRIGGVGVTGAADRQAAGMTTRGDWESGRDRSSLAASPTTEHLACFVPQSTKHDRRGDRVDTEPR